MISNFNKIIVTILALAMVSGLHAGGIRSLLEDFASISESRMAVQAALEHGYSDQEYFNELYEAEESIAEKIEMIMLDDTDIADAIIECISGSGKIYSPSLFSRFFRLTGREQELSELKKISSTFRDSFSEAEDFAGSVTPEGACLFEKPDVQSEVIAFADGETELTVSGSCMSFYKVTVISITGFLHESQLSNLPEDSCLDKSEERARKGTVTASVLNVRRGPGNCHKIKCTVKNGDVVVVLRCFCGWYKIITPCGRIGWSACSYIKIGKGCEMDDAVPVNSVDKPDSDNKDYGEADVSDTDSTTSIDIPADVSKFTKVANKKPTYYYTIREKNYTLGSEKSIKSTSGSVIAKCSTKYYKDLCMEGSGILRDGRCVTYISNKKFAVAPEGCKGWTSCRYWVVSFHTLAVNKKQMPYKGVYYIPKTRGLQLPDGNTHDGFWFAHDTGSAFTNSNNRIDMYVDKKEWWKPWAENNIANTLSPLECYRVDNATKEKVYAKYKKELGK